MAFDYDLAYADAQEILDEFGGTVTLTKAGITGGYNDDGDLIPDTLPANVTGLMSPLLSYKANAMAGEIEASGEKLIKGDKFAFFDAQGGAEVGMTAVVNGDTWRVQSLVELISLDGVKVLNKIHFRKG